MLKRLKTPFGIVEQHYFPVANEPEEVREFGRDDDELRVASVAALVARAENEGIVPSIAMLLNPEQLDHLWDIEAPHPTSDAEFTRISLEYGFALGDSIVRQIGLRWCVVSDQYGTDYAVRHWEAAVTTFPISNVSKRLESGETCFFQALAFTFLNEVAEALILNRATITGFTSDC